MGVICVKMTMKMYTRVHSYARYNMHVNMHYARYNMHVNMHYARYNMHVNMHMHVTICMHVNMHYARYNMHNYNYYTHLQYYAACMGCQ